MEMINIMTQYHNSYWSITSHNKYLLSIFRFLQESDYKLLYLMTSWDHLTVITQLFQCRHLHPRPERRDIWLISSTDSGRGSHLVCRRRGWPGGQTVVVIGTLCPEVWAASLQPRPGPGTDVTVLTGRHDAFLLEDQRGQPAGERGRVI